MALSDVIRMDADIAEAQGGDGIAALLRMDADALNADPMDCVLCGCVLNCDGQCGS